MLGLYSALQGCACVMTALTPYGEGFLEKVYRVLLGGGAACSGLLQEIFEQRRVIQILLGRSDSCQLWDFRNALRLRPCTGLRRWPAVHGCRGCMEQGLARLAL